MWIENTDEDGNGKTHPSGETFKMTVGVYRFYHITQSPHGMILLSCQNWVYTRTVAAAQTFINEILQMPKLK